MKTEQAKHTSLVTLGVIGGITGLLIDNALEDKSRGPAQMVLWTVLLLAFIVIQLHKSLRRPIQLLIAMALTGIHVCLLILFRSHFPLTNMIVGFVGMVIEAVIFIFLDAREGKVWDLKGPFGMTDAEREARRLKKAEWRNLFSPK